MRILGRPRGSITITVAFLFTSAITITDAITITSTITATGLVHVQLGYEPLK